MQTISLLVGGRSIEHDSSLHMFYYLRELLMENDRDLVQVAEVYYISSSGLLYKHDVSTAADIPCSEEGLKDVQQLDLSLLPHYLKLGGHFVFSLLQGTEGEDGHYQGIVNALDIPSNFGSVFSSAVSMHKWNQALIGNTVLTDQLTSIDTVILTSSPSDRDINKTVTYFAGRPCVLKPNGLGVSAFSKPVDHLTEDILDDFAQQVAPYDNRILVQERIFGRELSCGCVQAEQSLIALPVMELHVPSGFLSQSAKFNNGGYSYSFLPDSDEFAERLSAISLELFKFMDFDTACRFDYMVSKEGNIYLLEANSKPGLTEESHYTLMLDRAGYSLIDLIKFTIQNEARRFRPKTELRYDVNQVFVEKNPNT